MSHWDDPRWVKKIRGLNKVLSILVILAGFILVNTISARHFYRLGWQKRQCDTLTPFSREVISTLEVPIEVYLFYDRTKEGKIPDFIDDLRPLLREYKYASRDKVAVKFIDRTQQPRIAEELALRFGPAKENCIITTYCDRFSSIPLSQLYETHEGKRGKFCGEEVLSNEFLKLQNRNTRKITFTTGHGELDIDNVHPVEGGSALKTMLCREGYQVETSLLDVTLRKKHSQLLILAGPKTNFTIEEIEVIRQFLKDGGSVLVLLSAPKVCGLEGLFAERGIISEDKLIIDMKKNQQNVAGTFIVSRFRDHEIVREMLRSKLSVLLGLSQPVRINENVAENERYKITPFLFSGDRSYAKRDYFCRKPIYDSSEDLAGPISLAILSEVPLKDTKSHSEGPLAIIGSSSFASNGYFLYLGNQIFIKNIVNWLFEKYEPSLCLEKQQIKEGKCLVMTTQGLARIGFYLILAVVFIILLERVICELRRRL